MFAWLDRFSIRRQLWGLFALFLLAGASVLVIDEIEQQRARRTLQTLQDDALLGLRLIKTISDGYGLDVVDTTFRVRNDLVGWDEGWPGSRARSAASTRLGCGCRPCRIPRRKPNSCTPPRWPAAPPTRPRPSCARSCAAATCRR